MSKKSNRNGRAFEAIVFYDLINELRKSNINFPLQREDLNIISKTLYSLMNYLREILKILN